MRENGGLEVDCFVVLPSVLWRRLGRSQNGGIIVLLSAAVGAKGSGTVVAYRWRHGILVSFYVTSSLVPTPKVSDIDQ